MREILSMDKSTVKDITEARMEQNIEDSTRTTNAPVTEQSTTVMTRSHMKDKSRTVCLTARVK